MAARLTLTWLLAVCVCACASTGSKDEDIVLTGMRERLEAHVRAPYAHVARILGPVRHPTRRQLGITGALDSVITVVGTLTDPDVRTILALAGEQADEATRITGDRLFAVLHLGDSRSEPCCDTVVFERRDDTWRKRDRIESSH